MGTDAQKRGDDARFDGLSAESHSLGFLQKWFTVAKPEPDSGTDLVAFRRGSEDVTLGIQIKRSKKIAVRTPTFNRWLRHLDDVPIIVLNEVARSDFEQRYEYLVLYEWLREDPERFSRLYYEKEKRPERVSLTSGWTPLRSAADMPRFLQLVDHEIERVRLHRLGRSLRAPIGRAEVFSLLGSLAAVEPPIVFAGGSTAIPSRSATLQELARWRGSHAIPVWDDSSHLASRDVVRAEAAQAKSFFDLVRDPDELAKLLPRHSSRELASWRTLLHVHPEHADVQRRLPEVFPRLNSDRRCAALGLVSSLALSDDEGVRKYFSGMLKKLNREAPTGAIRGDAGYRLKRQHLMSSAEVFSGQSTPDYLDFFRSHGMGDEQPLLSLIQDYYSESKNAVTQRLSKVIEQPSVRQQNVLPIYAAYLEDLLWI